MDTAAATRRLVEVLADVNRTPGLALGQQASPLCAAAVGLRFVADIQNGVGDAEHQVMARINAAVAELAEAVDLETRSGARG